MTLRAKLAAVAGGLLVLGAITLAGGYALLGSRAGLDFLVRQAQDAARAEGIALELEQVAGHPLSSLTVGRVAASDKEGQFLAVEKAVLDWNPAALLRRTVEIGSVRIGRIAVDRVPVLSGAGRTPDGQGASQGLPPGVGVVLRALRIDRLEIGAALLGTPQEFRFTASAEMARDGSRARADAALRPAGGDADTAKFDLDFATAPARFGLEVRIDEPPGGPLARLAGLPPDAPLRLRIDGAGPPDNWRGRLTASLGGKATANLSVTAGVKARHVTLGLSGSADPAGFLPAGIRPLAAAGIGLEAALGFEPGRTFVVKSLTARTAAGRFEGAGSVSLADGALSAAVEVQAVADGPLAGLIAPARLGSAAVTAKISGTIAAPRIDAELSAGGVAAGGAVVDAIRSTAQITFTPAGTPDAVLNATAEGVRVQGVPNGLLSDRAELQLRASAEPDGGVSVSGLIVRAGSLGLDAEGKIDKGGGVEMGYRIAIDEIAPALRAANIALSGRAVVSGKATFAPRAPTVRTTVSGKLEQLRSGDRTIAALLGPAVPFSATVAIRGGTFFDVAKFEAVPAFGRLRLKGQADTGTGLVSARVEATAPQLARLSKLAGVPLAGGARLTANVTGAYSAPRIQARLTTDALAVSGETVDPLAIAAGLQLGADSVAGSVRLEGALRKRELRAGFAARLTGDRLDLSDVTLSLGKDALNGAATVTLPSAAVRGTLRGRFDDIGPLAALGGVGVSGRAAVRAEFANDGTAAGQAVTLAAELDDVMLPGGGHLGRAVLSARLNDVLRTPRLDGTLDLQRLALAGAKVTRARIAVRGSRSGASWDIDADGDWRGALALKAAGRVAQAGDAADIEIASLTGTAAGEPVRLRAPARLRLRAGGVVTGPVALDFAGGPVTGQVDWAPETVAARLAVPDLPARLAAFAAPGVSLSGKLAVDVKISGAPGRPDIDATVAIAELRPAGIAEGSDVRFQGKATLKQAANGVAAELEMSGGGQSRVALSVRSPATVSLATGEIAGGTAAAIAGKLSATGQLEMIDRMVGLGGDRLNGQLTADLALGGTIGRPDLRGFVRVQDGYYEGVATGIVLRNARARVALEGDRVTLEELAAEDGDDGTVTGSGSFRLSDMADAGLTLTFRKLWALRRPEADARISGSVSFGGGLTRPALKGALTVERAEIRIPDNLPQSVVTLDVVEIHGAAAPPPSPKSEDPSLGKALRIALDLSVNVPRRMFVRGRGLDSEWAGKLAIGGDSGQPRIAGTLSVVRGKFAFAGKSFNISTGKVFFRPETAEPEIQAVAEAAVADITAKIEISGKAGAPELAVSSTPPLPQEDVLSRILFGKTAGQLSAVQAAQLAQTALTLSGKGGGAGIMDRIRSALGVDVLDVEAGGNGDSRGASLKAGKYISDDVFLSVRQGTEPGSQRVGVEVEVLPNISVESDIGAAADSNVGVKWKWNY